MPPKQRGETLIFVINVGITRPGVQTNSDFLDKAKLIVRRLIEKKTFLRPKDEIGIILMGANVTENSLQFPNIQELTPVEVPNWEQIENLMKLESTNCLGNWAEAIALAVDYIRRETTPSNTRNLILLSDFNEEDDIMSQFHADAIAKDLIEEEICLLLIGTGALDEKPKDALSAGEKLLMDVRDKVHGCYMTTEEAMADVRFYKQFPTHPTAWTCTLELGDLRIPISVYVIVIREVKTPSWKLGTNDKKNPNEGIRTVTKHTELSDRLRGTYNVEGTVNGYMYGGVLIPFSKEDEEAMLYKNCEKSYKIHSFAKREDVDLDYWYGNGSRLVVPSHESSATAFYSLVQAMLNENVVAIVRKVYNSAPNTAPRMVALFPSADTNIADKPWGLVEIELPFAEDIRVIDTKTIRSILKQLTKPQEQAIDDLLNSMMLTEDNCIADGEELFSPGTIPNPSIQHLWDTLSHRVLHPDKPLPMVDEELSKLLDTPESVKERSVKPLQTIGKLFDLQEIETENSVKSENGVGNMKKGPGKQQPKKMKDDYMKNKNSNERMDSSGMDIDTMAANI